MKPRLMRRVSGMDCWQRVLYAVAITAVAATIAASSGCGASQQSVTAKVAAGIRTAHETTNRARDAYVESQRLAESAAVMAAQAMGGTPEEVEARGIELLRKLDQARGPVLAARIAKVGKLPVFACRVPSRVGTSSTSCGHGWQ